MIKCAETGLVPPASGVIVSAEAVPAGLLQLHLLPVGPVTPVAPHGPIRPLTPVIFDIGEKYGGIG